MAHPIVDTILEETMPKELYVKRHTEFLSAYEKKDDCTLDFLKLSGIFWTLTALDLLGELNLIDQDVQPDGSFYGDQWGEIDTRFSFCAIASLHLLGQLDECISSGRLNKEACATYLERCQNLDGGFGTKPGSESHAGQAYCVVGTLAILQELRRLDLERAAWWLAERQLPSGGINGRPEKKPDVCYSWWALATLTILGKIAWINDRNLIRFILAAQDPETGGIADRPGDVPDPFHTLFGLAGLSLIAQANSSRNNVVAKNGDYSGKECSMEDDHVSNALWVAKTRLRPINPAGMEPSPAGDHLIRTTSFGKTSKGEPVQLITINTEEIPSIGQRAYLQVCTLGAAVVACCVPGRDTNGKLTMMDIALGYKDASSYERNPSYLGVIVGRVAGRVQNGQFRQPETGEIVHLTRNSHGTHCVHGGSNGLSRVIWGIVQITDCSVTLQHVSVHGADGFPGTLNVEVEYSFLRTTVQTVELRINYQAKLATIPATFCPISLTNHTHWNLAGHSAGPSELVKHEVYINADKYVELNPSSLVPTGRLVQIQPGTAPDLRKLRPIASGLHVLGDDRNPGYDLYYVFSDSSTIEPSVMVYHRGSGIRMCMLTDQPGVQFYTGHYLDPAIDPAGKHGKMYEPSSGLCLEAQGFPDACNQPTFPAVFVRSGGEPYTQNTAYRFELCDRL
ncbi:hypothetical protein AHF37_02546 [Paragonimus kellicotti]|nr:hypothetical protein AHF37_02546 [Paragonimus kellicotti]